MLVANQQTSPFHDFRRQQTIQQYYPEGVDIDLAIDLDIDTDNSISSSPQSTQSFLSQLSAAPGPPLSNLDSIPAVSVPRGAQQEAFFTALPALDDSSMLTPADLMPSDSWLASNAQYVSKSGSRVSHHRESSLSSLGSAGPASPYSQNTSNPHIAVTDSVGDGYHGLPYYDDSSYQLAKSLSPANHDAFYGNHVSFRPETTAATAYASLLAAQKHGGDRGLLPPPDLSVGSNRSRPVSVASSVASDSPATPSLEQPEDDRRRKLTLGNEPPKLDRTMTDIYGDELYSPSFTITSASPSHPNQLPLSPNHEMFAQRLQAINNQHLSAAHSPVPSASRGKSPFRQGSPLAPATGRDFAANLSSSQLRYGATQQLREQHEPGQDVQAALRHQIARSSGTPQTISPKDAMLEFHDPDQGGNYSLFSSPSAGGFEGAQGVSQASQTFDNLSMSEGSGFGYLPSQLPAGLQVPQQYPFVAHARQKSTDTPMVMSSGVSSRKSNLSDAAGEKQTGRPAGTGADGGTYTCTYHGCTLRFETPALLQKHKREGHRQAHGLNGARRPDAGNAPGLLNSQAGPHRCDRINPSTGKPCNTIFSRPYDLTRHEDTIHNARKLKVRCNLCTEEKTFSRADALTRHYRVCHPDMELPGKHRRRVAHS